VLGLVHIIQRIIDFFFSYAGRFTGISASRIE
jgi:hypothetical protein